MTHTSGGTAAIDNEPLVSSRTSCPRARSRRISSGASFWRSGSPPVTSTVWMPNAWASATTSSSERHSPPVNVNAESHQVHRRLHPVVRTNTHGLPTWVDSPCTEA
jgi:hypothetical protein